MSTMSGLTHKPTLEEQILAKYPPTAREGKSKACGPNSSSSRGGEYHRLGVMMQDRKHRE